MEFSSRDQASLLVAAVEIRHRRLALILSDGLSVISIAGREEVLSVVGGDEIEVVCFCRIKGGINGFKSRVGDRTGG